MGVGRKESIFKCICAVQVPIETSESERYHRTGAIRCSNLLAMVAGKANSNFLQEH